MADINTTQMRDALAWATNDQTTANDASTNLWQWFWQAVQGDFNEDRSTGQIAMDAAISMIPLVDQICDVRDLIANCKKIHHDHEDGWAWVALVLTLIGIFPFLGSLVKGVLKIFFLFVRRAGGDAVIRGVDDAMTWIVTLLRRQAVQKYISDHKIDEIFGWLAKQIQIVRSKVSTANLLAAFDKTIGTLERLAAKVKYLPAINARVASSIALVRDVRQRATAGMDGAVAKVDDIFDTIIRRLEHEAMMKHGGIINTKNVHFRGAIPEAESIALIRNIKTRPDWISTGKGNYKSAKQDRYEEIINKKVAKGWPNLEKHNIESFHEIQAATIKGPAKLYRIVAPTSGGMGDCWISEKIFNKLNSEKIPKSSWRKYLAVWPHWNVNGQYVVYEIKRGEELKVWHGTAASQTIDSLKNLNLEGGWDQIIFKVDRSFGLNDNINYFKVTSSPGWEKSGISYNEYSKLTKQQQKSYTSIRLQINHPNISGPFETNWDYTDFNGKGFLERVGLPNFPGQLSNLEKS